jgi:hypothetical protein
MIPQIVLATRERLLGDDPITGDQKGNLVKLSKAHLPYS